MTEQTESREKISIGISSCLMGEEVRFDGGHKLDNYITGTLADYFDFIPVCPEVAIGLPIPRPPIRLVRQDDGIHVVGVKDPSVDVTDKLHAYGRKIARQLSGISGFILKTRFAQLRDGTGQGLRPRWLLHRQGLRRLCRRVDEGAAFTSCGGGRASR